MSEEGGGGEMKFVSCPVDRHGTTIVTMIHVSWVSYYRGSVTTLDPTCFGLRSRVEHGNNGTDKTLLVLIARLFTTSLYVGGTATLVCDLGSGGWGPNVNGCGSKSAIAADVRNSTCTSIQACYWSGQYGK